MVVFDITKRKKRASELLPYSRREKTPKCCLSLATSQQGEVKSNTRQIIMRIYAKIKLKLFSRPISCTTRITVVDGDYAK
jgi:hypothetical protein